LQNPCHIFPFLAGSNRIGQFIMASQPTDFGSRRDMRI
jgi:hypothetical protein